MRVLFFPSNPYPFYLYSVGGENKHSDLRRKSFNNNSLKKKVMFALSFL